MFGFGSRRSPLERKRKGIALVLWTVLLLPGPAAGQTWVWTTETVDKSGTATSLAADDAGNLHISYGGDQGELKYGFLPAGTSRWFTMTLSGGASYTNLKLDQQGNPHICSTSRKLRYAHFDGREWHTREIAPDPATIQFSCSVAIGPDGTPHVTWYRIWEEDAVPYAHVKYAVLKDGAWMIRTIDFEMQTGKWHSMVVDSQGNPYISYDSFVKGNLNCAHWDGKSWSVRVVDKRGGGKEPYNLGMGNSLLLDQQGKAQISYYTENTLRYARQQGDTWRIETVDNVTPLGSWIGYRTSPVLDKGGFPHISYEDAGAVKHAYWDGKQWRIQLISPAGSGQYPHSSMTIDREDMLYISYRDPADGSLKVAIGRRTEQPQTALVEKKDKN